MDERLAEKLRATTSEARAQRYDEEVAAAALSAIETRGVSLEDFLETVFPLTRDEILSNLLADDPMEVTYSTHIGHQDDEAATYEADLGFFNSQGSGRLDTKECGRKVQYQTALRDKLAEHFAEEGFVITTTNGISNVDIASRPEDEGYYPGGTVFKISLTLGWANLLPTE